LVICVFIVFFISIIFVFLFFYQHNNTIFNSNFLLEYFWTFIPVVLVVILFLPLFFFNNFLSSEFDFCYFIIGNQWFWDFIYLDDFVYSTSLFNYDFIYNSYPTVYLPCLYKLNFYLT
jgi:heme/copper-type cytochrome/quinol oxidase subunit 2